MSFLAGAAGLAAKGLGAFINRGWGNDPEAMLRYNGHINGLLNQDYSGDPVAAINRGMSGIKINRNDFGLFKGGDYNDMVNKMKFAQGWADRSGSHAVDNWDHKMITDGLSVRHALGGPLDNYIEQSIDTPIGFSLAVQKTVNDRSDMDTSSFPLSTDFLRDLGIIAQDESRMRRAIRYIKRLAAEKPDPTLMSKEEFSAKLERSEEQYRQGKYKAFTNIEDLDQYIRSL